MLFLEWLPAIMSPLEGPTRSKATQEVAEQILRLLFSFYLLLLRFAS